MLVSEVENKIPKDHRLGNEKFRQDVRLVLEFLGAENTTRNFKKYDAKYGSKTPINWEAFASNIRHPKQQAVVDILCRGEPTGKTTCVALPGATKSEAIKKLNKNQYKFERWL